MPRREPRALVVAVVFLTLGLLSTPRSRAEGDHQEVEFSLGTPVPFGPIVSELQPDGFTVRIGTADLTARPAHLVVFDEKARPGPQTPPLALVDSAAAVWHSLRVSGLVPGRRYRYRLTVDGESPAEGEVATAPPPGSQQPLLLAVVGDERGESEGVAPGARALIQSILAEGPDAVIGTGDLVTRSRLRDWRSLMYSHGPLFSQLLYLPALGNHELWSDDFDPSGQFVRQLFPALASGFYATRFGALLLVFLDGNRPGAPEQTRFLDAELGRAAHDPSIGARLVIVHQPPLSASAHCGQAGQMRDWVALFERHHVDAVIAGHDHTYQRLERNGVAYFVSGGGGAPLYERSGCSDLDEVALQKYEAIHHYLLVRITPRGPQGVSADGVRHDLVSVTAKVPQGATLDSVTLPLPRALSPEGQVPAIDPHPLVPHGARFVWFKLRRPLVVFAAGLAVWLGLRAARRRQRKQQQQR